MIHPHLQGGGGGGSRTETSFQHIHSIMYAMGTRRTKDARGTWTRAWRQTCDLESRRSQRPLMEARGEKRGELKEERKTL